VLLLDIGLPGKNGFDMASQVRAIQGQNVVRIIGISGFDDEEHVRLAEQVTFDEYLVKPLKLADLERALGRQASIASNM
jgi:YesN/AraC family two-component response regulator